MKADTLVKAVAMSQETGHIFVATADHGGLPHMAAAGPLILLLDEKRVAFDAWSCPHTLSNLSINRWLALVTWDSNLDVGYQLIGWVENIEDMALLNGYAPELEDKGSIPQAKKRFTLRVDKIIGFHRAAHSDDPL
jgi:hypothetical protein